MDANMKITCGIFLIDKNKNILICRVTNSKNHWSIPKGLCDKNEKLLDAALRELKEETSILLSNQNISFVGSFKYSKSNKILTAFCCNIDYSIDANQLRCESMVNENGRIFPEVDKYEWVSIEEAKKLIHETQILALDFIFNKTL